MIESIMASGLFKFLSETRFFQNRLLDYLIFISIVLFAVIVSLIVKKIVLERLKRLAEKTTNKFDDFVVNIINKALVPVIYAGSLYVGLQYLVLPQGLSKLISGAFMLFVMLFGVRFVLSLAGFGLKLYWAGKENENGPRMIITIIKIVIWVVAVLLFLDNLGVKISALVAGLGIGGIAVALAAQAVLADLFSYITIFFDRPFEIGDFIIVGDFMGTVENVGIKTTRVRSLGGEELIFSNTDLTSSRVRNYKRMNIRRIVFKLGVTYQTGLKEVKEIPVILRKIVESVKNTKFDRAHFSSYGDFSLNFEIVYYVQSADYNKYMDVQQEINFAVKEEFEKRKIEFAYPTQTLFMTK